MNKLENFRELIDGYIEGTLSDEQDATLQSLLVTNSDMADAFAIAIEQHVLLDEHFRELKATRAQDVLLTESVKSTHSLDKEPAGLFAGGSRYVRTRRQWSVATIAASVIAASLFFVVLMNGGGEKTVSAAVLELNRVIAASARTMDRTYQITEEREDGARPSPKRPKRPDRRGPPPPPAMNNARLYLRGGGRFVLVREALDGRPFVAGSNGTTGWAIFPDGPVRVSPDPKRFTRGLPGEQHSIPLINIQEGLQGLVSAYDIELDANHPGGDENATRLLVAQRKSPQHLGPRRVEITYVVENGLIQRIRFIDMPRDRESSVTLQLTLIDQATLEPDFFEHTSHHGPERAVVVESNLKSP